MTETLPMSDKDWMQLALAAAVSAPEADMPVGAVLVCDGKEIARAANRSRTDDDPTAHAEMLVLREGAKKLGSSRLNACTLYVTLEPCPMCAAAVVTARVGRLVYGASSDESGERVLGHDFNRTVSVTGGVCADECASLLGERFVQKRKAPRRIANLCLSEGTFVRFLALTNAVGIEAEASEVEEADTVIAEAGEFGHKKKVAPPKESDEYLVCCVLFKRVFDRTPAALPAANGQEEATRRRAIKYRG